MQLRETVRAGPPLFRVRAITTQNDAIAQTMLRERLLALLSVFFGVVGLTLAAIGLYGVLSYTVLQRTKEIGVRIALGAGQGQVVRSILKGIGSAAAIGVICGLGGALYLSQFVRTLLFEVTPLDFWSLALPLSAMMVVAVIAATIPGVRASRVDPVVALRRD
jgi:ABC-type antimicrobial peptide transport system permease subunit